MPRLSELCTDLCKGKNFAVVTTLMKDGSPQASVVWVDCEDDFIVFNTAEGRTKTRNMRRDPRVAIAIWDAQNPYRQSMVRGRVVSITEKDGDEVIERLSQKYLGKPYPFRRPGEVRLTVKIAAEGLFDLK